MDYEVKPYIDTPIGGLRLLISIIPMLVQLFANETTPLGRAVYKAGNILYPNQIPTITDAINLYIRGKISQSYFFELCAAHGYKPEMVNTLRQSIITYLSSEDYTTLYRRQIISENDWYNYLNINNLNVDEAEHLLQATQFFPPVQDLIRFAVREVYTPDIRKKYGMDDDRPLQFLNEGTKAGLSNDHAANYWAAHWELPSAEMGYEMLHRGIINEQDLKELLKSLDVMPFWRDKLMDISYNVITRVDVRRMYSLGVYDYDDVLSTYKKMGYNEKDATDLTDFTVLYESDETTGLTRASLINSYKDDLITEKELRDYLIALRYTDTVTEYWINQANFEKTELIIGKVKTDLIARYRMGVITTDTIRDELNKYNLPSQYIDRVINDVVIEKSKRTKVPPVEDLLLWFGKSIIDEDYFTARMRQLGYSDADILNYITQYALDIDTSTRRFLTEAQYLRFLKKGIMTEKDFRITLTAKGVSEEDINNLILESQE